MIHLEEICKHDKKEPKKFVFLETNSERKTPTVHLVEHFTETATSQNKVRDAVVVSDDVLGEIKVRYAALAQSVREEGRESYNEDELRGVLKLGMLAYSSGHVPKGRCTLVCIDHSKSDLKMKHLKVPE